MSRFRIIAGLALAAGVLVAVLAATATEDPVKALEAKVNALTQRLATLEKEIETLKGTIARANPSPELENEAMTAFKPIADLIDKGDAEQARTQLDTYMKKYGNTRAGRQAQSMARELAVVGKAVPVDWKIEKWFQGENDLKPKSGPTVLVFWETWCPHCRREVPKLQTVYDKFRGDGLQMVGLVKLTQGATEAQVQDFIMQNKLSYPMAKEDGTLSALLEVQGIPAAAVVKDGKVVWRGHPAKLTEAMLAGWVS